MKICKICKSDNTIIKETEVNNLLKIVFDDRIYQVVCATCGNSGKPCSTKNVAISDWNSSN